MSYSLVRHLWTLENPYFQRVETLFCLSLWSTLLYTPQRSRLSDYFWKFDVKTQYRFFTGLVATKSARFVGRFGDYLIRTIRDTSSGGSSGSDFGLLSECIYPPQNYFKNRPICHEQTVRHSSKQNTVFGKKGGRKSASIWVRTFSTWYNLLFQRVEGLFCLSLRYTLLYIPQNSVLFGLFW